MAKREMKSTNVDEVAENVNVQQPEEKPVENKKVTGVVAYCTKLNVRKEPSLKSEVVAVLDVDTKVSIDRKETGSEWYAVSKKPGVEGFCMKKYIKIV